MPTKAAISTSNFPRAQKVEIVDKHGTLHEVPDYRSLDRVLWQMQNDIQSLAQGIQNPQFRASKRVIANYQMAKNEEFIEADATIGPIRVVLPDAASLEGQIRSVKRTNGGANLVTVVGRTPVQTIDGQSSKDLTVQYESNDFQAHNGTWTIV